MLPAVRSSRLAILWIWFVLFLCAGNRAPAFQDPAGAPPMTLDLQRALVMELASRVLERSSIGHGERILVRVDAVPERWITEQAFLQAARAGGYEVSLSDTTTPVAVELRAPAVGVRYSDSFQDGFLGTRKTVRTVWAGFSCVVSAAPRGDVRLSYAFASSISDTVRVDDIPSLESSSVRSTQGSPPSDGFLDRIVEPFIIVGATGVAVYLLFNIRS